MTSQLILWIVAIIVFVIVEAILPELVSIWFAVGSTVALIFAMFGVNLEIQILVFAITSLIVLLAIRPISKKYLETNPVATNADSLIGEVAIVTMAIDFLGGTGEVKVHGVRWSAISNDHSTIEEGTIVKIFAIKGVKLVVAPIEN